MKIRNQQDAGAGLFLIAVAAFFFWQAFPLDIGSLRAVGPGMLPRALATIVAGLGALLIVIAFMTEGPDLERWSWRGPLFVLGAIAVFALSIRTLGLAFAGPLCMIIGSYASPETRLKETVVFSLVMTALCILLFKVLLGLPIPVIAFNF